MAGYVKGPLNRQRLAAELLELGYIGSFGDQFKINSLHFHDVCDMACNRDRGINGRNLKIQRPLLVRIEDSGKLTEIPADLKRDFIMGEF